jgi:hypothetical protein
MKNSKKTILCLLIFFQISLKAQEADKPIFEKIEFSKKPCISEEQRLSIKYRLNETISQLKIDNPNIIQNKIAPMIPSFGWPLRQAAGFTEPGYYSINNYVDHDVNTGSLGFNQFSLSNKDYNCGKKTYDTNNGYNHQGIDINLFPWRWEKMDDNAVEVIAADAGIIIGKDNGNFDKNCSCSGDWNAVYVRHSDNSQVWYGHLKNGSLTTKSVGQTVAKGEYIGVVGSSGCSSDPHLHLEVFNGSGNLIDPFGGNCNVMNGNTSWWTNQPNYTNPTINKIMTHNFEPFQNYGCPADRDIINSSNTFTACNKLWWSAHIADYTLGSNIVLTIENPTGVTVMTENLSFTNSSYPLDHYPAAWWKYNYNIPCNGPNGTWKLKATYGTQIVTHLFNVSGAALPIELIDINAKQKGNTNLLTWQTATETNNKGFEIEKSNNGKAWQNIGFVAAKGSHSSYEFMDNAPLPISYYRLNQIDTDGKNEYSKTVSINNPVNPKKTKFTINPNPATGVVNLTFSNSEKGSITIVDALGRVVHKKTIQSTAETNLEQWHTEGVARGLYFVTFAFDNQVSTLKLMLK